jgi:hypothetical protein
MQGRSIPLGWSSCNSVCSTQAIFEVTANPDSTIGRRYLGTIYGGNRCGSQHCYPHKMAGCLNRSQPAAHVFYQWDLKRRLNMVPTGAEAALRGSYDEQEVEALLLDPHNPGCVGSAVSMSPWEHRSNRADHSMGSGNRPIWCRIHPSLRHSQILLQNGHIQVCGESMNCPITR